MILGYGRRREGEKKEKKEKFKKDIKERMMFGEKEMGG